MKQEIEKLLRAVRNGEELIGNATEQILGLTSPKAISEVNQFARVGTFCKECNNVFCTCKSLPSSEAEWISVDDRLPEMYKDVLVISGHGNLIIAQLGGDEERFFNSSSAVQPYIDTVTHWMPLPAPPQYKLNTKK